MGLRISTFHACKFMEFCPRDPTRIVAFAAGRGGDPSRYQSLIRHLGEAGCWVIAPTFEFIPSMVPSHLDLHSRAQLMESVLNSATGSSALPLVGLGHSIGAVILLAMAGGTAHTLNDGPFTFASNHQFRQIALLAPVAEFFTYPYSSQSVALDEINADFRIWVGGKDGITPPAQMNVLTQKYPDRNRTIIDPDADHFTFMDNRPPNAHLDTHPRPAAYREALAGQIVSFFDQQTA